MKKVTKASELKKGDKIHIEGNSILGDCMNIPVATGTVFAFHAGDKGFGFRCDQTGAIEGCDFGDGDIFKVA